MYNFDAIVGEMVRFDCKNCVTTGKIVGYGTVGGGQGYAAREPSPVLFVLETTSGTIQKIRPEQVKIVK